MDLSELRELIEKPKTPEQKVLDNRFIMCITCYKNIIDGSCQCSDDDDYRGIEFVSP